MDIAEVLKKLESFEGLSKEERSALAALPKQVVELDAAVKSEAGAIVMGVDDRV